MFSAFLAIGPSNATSPGRLATAVTPRFHGLILSKSGF